MSLPHDLPTIFAMTDCYFPISSGDVDASGPQPAARVPIHGNFFKKTVEKGSILRHVMDILA